MVDEKRVVITLADGTVIEGQSDGAGNVFCQSELDKSIFSSDNLKEITLEENGSISHLENMALRTFYYEHDGTLIRIDQMTEGEILKAENAALKQENEMLEDALVELAELIGG